MKKFWAVLLAVLLSMSVLVTVSSCSIIGDIMDIIDNLEDDFGDDGHDDNDNDDDDNDDDDDDDNTGGGGTVSSSSLLPGDTVKSKLKDYGKNMGFVLSFKVSYTGSSKTTITEFGMKGNTIWVKEGDSGRAYVKQGENMLSDYTLDNGKWEFNSTQASAYVDSAVDNLFSISTTYLVIASNTSYNLKESGSETVAGRLCTKYSYRDSSVVSYDYSASVDKELGITMKYRSVVSSGGESISTETEVTSFKTGTAVNLPSLPSAGEDYIDYEGILGWPANSYTAVIPQLPGKISMSGIENGTFATISACTKDQFDTYVASLLQKGFAGQTTDAGFEGDNPQNYHIECTFINGSLSVSLRKTATR